MCDAIVAFDDVDGCIHWDSIEVVMWLWWAIHLAKVASITNRSGANILDWSSRRFQIQGDLSHRSTRKRRKSVPRSDCENHLCTPINSHVKQLFVPLVDYNIRVVSEPGVKSHNVGLDENKDGKLFFFCPHHRSLKSALQCLRTKSLSNSLQKHWDGTALFLWRLNFFAFHY